MFQLNLLLTLYKLVMMKLKICGGCDASVALWEQALQLVEERGLGENVTSPSIYVDNYLINGEFVSKEDNIEDWSHKTSHEGF